MEGIFVIEEECDLIMQNNRLNFTFDISNEMSGRNKTLKPSEKKRLETEERVVRLWSILHNQSIKQTKEEFENSKTYQVLMDPVSALWKESAAYICEKFQYELDRNWEMWMR